MPCCVYRFLGHLPLRMPTYISSSRLQPTRYAAACTHSSACTYGIALIPFHVPMRWQPWTRRAAWRRQRSRHKRRGVHTHARHTYHAPHTAAHLPATTCSHTARAARALWLPAHYTICAAHAARCKTRSMAALALCRYAFPRTHRLLLYHRYYLSLRRTPHISCHKRLARADSDSMAAPLA